MRAPRSVRHPRIERRIRDENRGAPNEAGETTETLEDGTVVPLTMDAWTTDIRTGVVYNERGQVEEYAEASFDGTTLSLGGTERAWTSLSEAEKSAVLAGESAADDLHTG